MVVEKGSLEYRILVELNRHGRLMTARELSDALDSTCAPARLHLALHDLGDCLRHGQAAGAPTWRISWEGVEALRRADLDDTRRMRRVSDMTWWERIKRVWKL